PHRARGRGQPPSRRAPDVRYRLAAAVVCASCADGAFAFHGVLAAHGSLSTALEAFVVASAVFACAVAPVALACVFVFGRSRPLARGVARLVARCAGGHGAFAAFVVALALGEAAVRAAILGRAIVAGLTPYLAAPALVVVSFVLVAV